jgi:hypothetical protein
LATTPAARLSRAAASGAFRDRDVRTSHLQRLGVDQEGFRRLLPLSRARRRGCRCRSTTLSSRAVAPTRTGSGHARAWCTSANTTAPWATPVRARACGAGGLPPSARPSARAQAHPRVGRPRKPWVSRYVANSKVTRRRIERYWGREAGVIHPAVDVHRFSPAEPEDYRLVVTELVRHSASTRPLEAARPASLPLKAVGTGPELKRLRSRHPARGVPGSHRRPRAHGVLLARAGSTGRQRRRVRNRRRGGPGGRPRGRRARRWRHPGDGRTRRDRRLGPAGRPRCSGRGPAHQILPRLLAWDDPRARAEFLGEAFQAHLMAEVGRGAGDAYFAQR